MSGVMRHYIGSVEDPPDTDLVVWYDPSDLATLFQDDDGLVPVTTSGQDVRKMLDKSGNGNHVIFGAGTSIVYDETAGLRSLQYVNAYMECDTLVGCNSVSQLTHYGAWSSGGSSNRVPVVICNPAVTDVAIEWQIQTNPSVYVNPAIQVTFSGGATPTNPYVVEFGFDGPASGYDKGRLVFNGVPRTATGGAVPSLTTTPADATLLRILCFSSTFPGNGSGNFYGCSFYTRILTGSELFDVEQFYAAKCGISI